MNKTATFISLFFNIMFLMATLPSQAAEPQKLPQKTDFIKTVDKNADGKVSKAEFFAAMAKKFDSMDVDKSEVLSVQEFKLYGEKDVAARKKAQQAATPEILAEKTLSEEAFTQRFIDRAEREFIVLDKNHDNEISSAEAGVKTKPKKTKKTLEKNMTQDEFVSLFTESAAQHFSQLDKNFDGELTNEELGLLKSRPEPKAKTAVIAAEPQPDAKQVQKQKLIKSFFAGMDANNDGQISTTEKNAAFERLFNRLDSNHDQFITQDEIIASQHAPAANNQ
jgi:Ca2+-binding EF-hand superfamily protein